MSAFFMGNYNDANLYLSLFLKQTTDFNSILHLLTITSWNLYSGYLATVNFKGNSVLSDHHPLVVQTLTKEIATLFEVSNCTI